MAAHASLGDSELHEIKGAAGASAGQVPVADGAGASPFGSVPAASISGLNNNNIIYIQGRIADLSTASSVYVPCPLAGDIVSVVSVLQGAIASTDATLRLRISATPVTDSNITIVNSSSAAGDVDTATPTAANTVTANSAIEIQNLGTATTAEAAEILIAIDVS